MPFYICSFDCQCRTHSRLLGILWFRGGVAPGLSVQEEDVSAMTVFSVDINTTYIWIKSGKQCTGKQEKGKKQLLSM